MNAGREKVEREGGCRSCGDTVDHTDAAHLVDRGTGGGDFSDPDLIIPLCSRIKGGQGCHDMYDALRLDVLPLLSLDEQAAMVKRVGILRAMQRATGAREGSGGQPYSPF